MPNRMILKKWVIHTRYKPEKSIIKPFRVFNRLKDFIHSKITQKLFHKTKRTEKKRRILRGGNPGIPE